jgi:hypothetical protein
LFDYFKGNLGFLPKRVQHGLNWGVTGSGIGLPLKGAASKNMKSYRGVRLLMLAACHLHN